MTFELDILVGWKRGIDQSLLILKYFTTESGSSGACVQQKDWKVAEREEEVSEKMRSLVDMDKFGNLQTKPLPNHTSQTMTIRIRSLPPLI